MDTRTKGLGEAVRSQYFFIKFRNLPSETIGVPTLARALYQLEQPENRSYLIT